MIDVNIYLSSTDFRLPQDSILDVEWKNTVYDSINSLVDKSRYNVSCHDPLKVISDKAEIVIDDITHIDNSDFVICYLPKTKLSIGTLMELQYSCIRKSKDNIILIDRYHIHRNHPWIKYWIKHIADDELEAVSLIVNILGNW